ncbi:MAG: hypothetical protein QRY74_06215 [Chlamydia sp.]
MPFLFRSILCCLFTGSLYCYAVNREEFQCNSYLQKREFQHVSPHLLSDENPLKPILDTLFSKERVTFNKASLEKAGFMIKFDQPRSYIIVAAHPLLPGYLIKLYLDSELRLKRNIPGWRWFVQRVRSAKTIDRVIKEKNIQNFVVPKKWIYALPATPLPENSRKYARKNEILIVEDMDLCSRQESEKAWKSVITERHLKELVTILQKAGGSGYRPENIVYTKSGKFAFIDTEYHKKVSDYRGLSRYLSSKMGKKWDKMLKLRKMNKKK